MERPLSIEEARIEEGQTKEDDGDRVEVNVNASDNIENRNEEGRYV